MPLVYDDIESTPSSKLAYDDESGKSVGGFVKNIGSDVINTAKGVGNLAVNLAKHPIDTPIAVAKHLPGALIEEGKRIGLGGEGGLLNKEFPYIHPIDATQKFGGAFYDKPLTTALDVLPAIGTAGKALGIGGEAAKGAEIAGEAGNLAEDFSRMANKAPRPIELPGEASQILKEPITPPPGVAEQAIPTGSTFQETVSNLKNKIPGEVKEPLKQVGDYLNSKYGQIAQKPGWGQTLGSYANEHAQNMALKTAGFSPAQIRKIGIPESRALGDLMLERGMVSGKVGPQGLERMVNEAHGVAGNTIGGIRKIATQRGAIHDMDQVVNAIKTKLDPVYTQGLKAGEKGSYMKALAELKRTEPTADAVSKKISELFSESKKMDRLKQPSGATADVARELRDINEGLIKKKLSPKEIDTYEKSLDEYGAMTQIKEGLKRRNSMEAGGRLGPGAGLSRMMIQKFLDSVGYRTEAQIAKKLSGWIKEHPEAASSPKALFQKYIDEAAEAVDEMGDVNP